MNQETKTTIVTTIHKNDGLRAAHKTALKLNFKGPKNKESTGGNFDIADKLLLLTWPLTELTKEQVYENIMATNDIKFLAVAKEEHENGLDHIHAYVEFVRRRITTSLEMDAWGGKHGHYKRIDQTPLKALAYVVKDKNYITTDYRECEAASAFYKHMKPTYFKK